METTVYILTINRKPWHKLTTGNSLKKVLLEEGETEGILVLPEEGILVNLSKDRSKNLPKLEVDILECTILEKA